MGGLATATWTLRYVTDDVAAAYRTGGGRTRCPRPHASRGRAVSDHDPRRAASLVRLWTVRSAGAAAVVRDRARRTSPTNRAGPPSVLPEAPVPAAAVIAVMGTPDPSCPIRLGCCHQQRPATPSALLPAGADGALDGWSFAVPDSRDMVAGLSGGRTMGRSHRCVSPLVSSTCTTLAGLPARRRVTPNLTPTHRALAPPDPSVARDKHAFTRETRLERPSEPSLPYRPSFPAQVLYHLSGSETRASACRPHTPRKFCGSTHAC